MMNQLWDIIETEVVNQFTVVSIPEWMLEACVHGTFHAVASPGKPVMFGLRTTVNKVYITANSTDTIPFTVFIAGVPKE